MIAKITGTICDVFDKYLIVDVGGVGYKIEVPDTLGFLSQAKVVFYTHTHYRENEVRLFGFTDKEDLLIFEELLNISGVGPKAALTLIAKIGKSKIVHAIRNKDAKLLKAPGIGEKTAARIIVDLAAKIDKMVLNIDDQQEGHSKSYEQDQYLEDIFMALIDLGYKRNQLEEVSKQIEIDSSVELAITLKEFLKYLSTNK